MQPSQGIQFKDGTMLHLAKDVLSDHHRRLIDSLIISGVPLIINTNLSRWAYDLISSNPIEKTKIYNSPLQRVPLYSDRVLTDIRGLNGHVQEAVKILSREVEHPILINVSLGPGFSRELKQFNEGAGFVIAGCQIMDGNAVFQPVRDDDDLKDDVSVPAVTLKLLQDKALKYDLIGNEFNEFKQAHRELLPQIEKMEKLTKLFEVAYENMPPLEFLGKLADIMLDKEEPETFDRADYRDE